MFVTNSGASSQDVYIYNPPLVNKELEKLGRKLNSLQMHTVISESPPESRVFIVLSITESVLGVYVSM